MDYGSCEITKSIKLIFPPCEVYPMFHSKEQ